MLILIDEGFPHLDARRPACRECYGFGFAAVASASALMSLA
jgi:hypothetical protein